ncbi:MAG: hypothetical protein ACI4CT_08695 [Lachnospiraceae bacterium]
MRKEYQKPRLECWDYEPTDVIATSTLWLLGDNDTEELTDTSEWDYLFEE